MSDTAGITLDNDAVVAQQHAMIGNAGDEKSAHACKRTDHPDAAWFAEACRKHGIKVGFYYSPPD